MLTPSTTPRGDSDLRSRFARSANNEDLLGRRINRQQRKKAASASGGAIKGIAEIDSVKETVLHSALGLDRISIRYSEPWDFGVPDIMRAAEFCSVNLNGVYLAPGAYTIAVRVDYGWAAGTTGVPSSVQASVANTGDPSDAPVGGWDHMIPVVTRSADAGTQAGVSGISTWLPPMPTIITSEDDLLWVELSCFQPAPIGTPVTGVNNDPGLHWTIWKWS